MVDNKIIIMGFKNWSNSTKIQASICLYFVGIVFIASSGVTTKAIELLSKIGTNYSQAIVPGLILGNLPGFMGILILACAIILISAYMGERSVEKNYGCWKDLLFLILTFILFSILGPIGYILGKEGQTKKKLTIKE